MENRAPEALGKLPCAVEAFIGGGPRRNGSSNLAGGQKFLAFRCHGPPRARDRTDPLSSPIDRGGCALHPRSMLRVLRATRAEPVDEVKAAPAEEDLRPVADQGLNESARKALRGDAFAVREFLHAIAPLVRSIGRGVMGRHHPELEDAIQDSLIDIVRALPQFRFETDVSHYATKITMRRAIASRERARARSRQHASVELYTLPVASFDDAAEARADLVRNLLDDLNEDQATVLRLRLMLGHSMNEIASITGVSINTVKTRLRLGKNQLRRWLERSGEGPRARSA
jgi:RNA polymerase sigma factor (sigma-70 family)